MTAPPAHKRTMAEITALLAAEKTKSSSTGNKQSYPFWNMPDNSTVLIRMVPDLDEDNPYCWVEKRQIRMTFTGMLHSDFNTDGDVVVSLVCPETFGIRCPITDAIRAFWNGNADEVAIAKSLYRKPSFIVGAFIVSSPFAETTVPENPIRTLSLNRSVFENVKSGLSNAEFEDLPWDTGDGGRDFKIVKTKPSQYASYSTSAFAYKARGLNEKELAAIEQYGLPDLRKELGPIPGHEYIEAMRALYRDWMAGAPFDNAKYGQFFKAFPVNNSGGGAAMATTPRRGGTGSGGAAVSPEAQQQADDVLAKVHRRPTHTKLVSVEDTIDAGE